MSDTIERLRAVRVKLDAARATQKEALDKFSIAITLASAEGHPLPGYDRITGLANRLAFDALEEEYTELAMELAEEVCR